MRQERSDYRSQTRVTVMCVLGSIASIAVSGRAIDAETKRDRTKAPSRAVAAWNRIQSTRGAGKKGGIEYWTSVSDVCFRELRALAAARDQRGNLEYFVRQFGKRGNDADMRWLIAERHNRFCADSAYTPKGNDRKVRLLVAELEVRYFLANPKALETYTHQIVWHGRFFQELGLPVRIGMIERGLRKKDSPDYWWHARDVILLAQATGRSDLLRDTKPDSMNEVFGKWYWWFKTNGMYLRAHSDSAGWVLDKSERNVKRPNWRFLTGPFTLPALNVKAPLPNWKWGEVSPELRALL